ncbi:MAG: lipid-A-disaccharide synthase, partial [bacterium]
LAPGLSESEAARHVDGTVRLVRDADYQARRGMTAAITASGTATLENALLGIPMVVCYRLSTVSYWITRFLIRVPHISLANILAGRAVVPEVIQGDVTPERLAAPVLEWLDDPSKRLAVRTALLKVRADLGAPGAADRAARAVLAMAA